MQASRKKCRRPEISETFQEAGRRNHPKGTQQTFLQFSFAGKRRAAMKNPYQMEAQRAIMRPDAMAADENPAVQMMFLLAELTFSYIRLLTFW
jgi:hypothetical protein